MAAVVIPLPYSVLTLAGPMNYAHEVKPWCLFLNICMRWCGFLLFRQWKMAVLNFRVVAELPFAEVKRAHSNQFSFQQCLPVCLSYMGVVHYILCCCNTHSIGAPHALDKNIDTIGIVCECIGYGHIWALLQPGQMCEPVAGKKL